MRLALLACAWFAAGAVLVFAYERLHRDAAAQTTASRTVTVRFLAGPTSDASFEFRALAPALQVETGRLYDARFLARNLNPGASVAQAVPSIQPERAIPYFHKTECFCFTPQRFAAGESRELPVRFLVDRELPADIGELTVSYALLYPRQGEAGKERP